jgi:serine phosphatase RsbU (regulator of sigma subunit)
MGVLLGIAALPLGLLFRWTLQKLRRLFHRDLTTARDLILGNLRETKKRFSEDALIKGLTGSLQEAFRPQVLLVLPVDDRKILLPPIKNGDPGHPFAQALAEAQSLALPSHVLRHARENREVVLGLGSDESEWIQEQGPTLRAHVDALGLQVMVLLMAGEDIHTTLLLGGKYAELNYGREDRELLREVSIAAGMLLESAVLHRRLLDQGRLEQELQTARKIQESLVTSEVPHMQGYQVALRLDPTFETGGDLLWVKRRQTGRWIAAVGDVSGKGLAAALYMSQATALLKFATQKEGVEFENLLPALDHTLRNLMGPKDFLTLSVVEWTEEGSFRLLRAGHPPAILVRSSNPEGISELEVAGRGLGLRPSTPGDWKVYSGTLEPGQWLVMYSDGLTEAMNTKGELYGLKRFKDQLRHYWTLGSPRAACEAIFHDVAHYEVQNRDDRTLFILGREHP